MEGKYIFLLLVLLCITDYIVTNKIETDQTNNGNSHIIDVLHENIPDISHFYKIEDFILGITVIVFFWLYKFKYVKDFAILFIIIRTLRLITMSVTILPKPVAQHNNKYKNTIMRFFFGGANDLIFSGHTAFMLLLLLFISKSVHGNMGKLLLVVYALIYSFIIILLRNHYTVDVILAWYITITTYALYYDGLSSVFK